MEKIHRNKIFLLIQSLLILFLISGCTPKINPNNNEINVLLFFTTRTEHNGETQINEFKKGQYDNNTLIYYIRWKYLIGDNTNEREHLVVYKIDSLNSELYPLDIVSYEDPMIKESWEEVKRKDNLKVFTSEQIKSFIKAVEEVRKIVQ